MAACPCAHGEHERDTVFVTFFLRDDQRHVNTSSTALVCTMRWSSVAMLARHGHCGLVAHGSGCPSIVCLHKHVVQHGFSHDTNDVLLVMLKNCFSDDPGCRVLIVASRDHCSHSASMRMHARTIGYRFACVHTLVCTVPTGLCMRRPASRCASQPTDATKKISDRL
jgi:hypothetical protein